MTEHFGQFESEKIAQENTMCREIVQEINRFGVNDRQRLMIIYLMALELENIEHMREVSGTVRSLNSDMFISDKADDDGQNNT